MAGLAIALVSVLAIVLAAVQADGRNASREDTNDGGAWLLDRRAQAVGHVDRASRQVSGATLVADAGEQFDVEQAPGVIVVHNEADGTASLVDPRTYARTVTVDVPDEATVMAVDGAVVVATTDPLQVWRIPVDEVGRSPSLGDLDTVLAASGQGAVAPTRNGAVVAAEVDSGRVHVVAPDGTVAGSDEGLVTQDPAAVSAIGDRAVVVGADGQLTTWATEAGTAQVDGGAPARDGLVQQPGLDSSQVVFAEPDGQLVGVDVASGDGTVLAQLDGRAPLAPIVHGGCVFTVTVEPAATFARVCGDDVYTAELGGLTGSELRLRLVNGWVWVNAIDSGEAWVAGLEGELDEVDDLGDSLATEEDTGDEVEGDDPDARQQQDLDSDRLGNQDRRRDGPNEAPVARDDNQPGRMDRPVVVDVLDNDTDPDGDALVVESVDGVPDDAVAVPTANRGAIQVTPQAGFEGTVRFTYTITDGFGGSDDATVSVAFSQADPENNRAPEPTDDVAATSPGTPVSLDLLANDTDPDGDTLALVDVADDGGTAVWSPGGALTFTPDTTTTTNLELTYTVADDVGATAEGRVVVNIRPVDEDSRPPDARNDVAVTVVDKAVTLDVVANDLDPDGDPLSVSSQPTLIRGPNDGAGVYTSMTTDGIFLVDPSVAGTYIWLYTISDGGSSDTAQIRVEVTESDTNQPPVAVRDDVVIPLGGTRLVPVLRNDGDPDGDVIGIVDWSGAPGLIVEEVPGVGFRVTVQDTAAPREQFQYQISDGVNDPVGTSVVVSVTDTTAEDQPPIARPDVIEVQPGLPTTLDVLANDYDPEGGSLTVAGHSDPTEGSLSVTPDEGALVLELPEDARSGFTFGYEAADEAGNRGSATVQVRVIRPEDPNRPPIARPDVVTTLEDQVVTIDAVANDSDPDGDVIRIESIAAQPGNGTVAVEPDGRLSYQPDRGFTGTDRMGYTLVDARGDRVRGDVLVGVMPQATTNRPPQAVDDRLEVVAGLGAQSLDVLANDRDPDGDRIRVVGHSDPRTGQARTAANGAGILFTPPDEVDQQLEVAFRYSIDDGAGHQDDAIVTVTILPTATPQPPIARDDQAGPTVPDSTVTVDVLANDDDPDGEVDDLELSSDDPAVEVTDDRQLEITVEDATRSFVYTITDVDGQTATAGVTVVVLANRPPTVEPLRVETPFETPITLELTDQASDPDEGDTLSFTCCDGVRGGSATVDSTSSDSLVVTFTPDDGFDGEAGLSYTVDDGEGHEVSGSAVVRVLGPTNRPPAAGDQTLDVEVGRQVDVDLARLVTDPDIDDTLTVDLGGVSGPMQVSLAGTTATVAPEDTAAGTTGAFTYTARDGAGETDEGNVTVRIVPSTLPPPEARPDQARTTQGEPVTVPVLDNDVGEGLRVVSAASPAGDATVTGDGTAVTFTPGPDFFGTAQATYVIRDRFDTDERSATGQVAVTVIGYPDQPAPPQATADSRQATLTWGAPATNGAPIDQYRINVIVGDQVTESVDVGATTTHTVTGLSNGTEYQFAIQAHNEAGWGPASQPSQVVVPDVLPGRPAPPRAEFADGALEVTWDAPENDGTPISSYVLEIGGGTSGSREVAPQGATTTYTWDGLENGTDYTFRVRAVNDKGEGDFSAYSAPEHPLTSPSAPPKPTLENGPNYLQVTWAVPDNGGDTISTYDIEISDPDASPAVVSGESTVTYRWTNLPNGVEYQFRVRGNNRDPDPGAWSPLSDPGKACDRPEAPGDPSAARGDRQATVTWTAPADNGCSVSGYNIRVAGTSNVQSAGSGATSHAFTGLSNGTSYRFEVQAVNEIGPGPWSAPTNAVTPAGPPTAPTNTSTSSDGDNDIIVTISPAEPNGSSITHYVARLNGGPAQDVGQPGSVPGGSGFRFANQAYNTEYCVEVAAVNDVGQGSWSNTRCARTLGPPSTPSGFSASSGNGHVRFTWNAASGTVTRYEVLRSGASNVNNGTDRTYNWDANYPTTRTASVRACNNAGCSAASPQRSAQPNDQRRVTISRGGSATSQPGCSDPSCEWIDATVRSFSPNTTLRAVCQHDRNGSWQQFEGTTGRAFTTNGSGNFDVNNLCYYGYPGSRVRVVVTGDPGGTKNSNTIVW